MTVSNNMIDKELQLSVVVCTYNRAELLAGCLESLIGQTLTHDQYEIIVVDNNSSDRTSTLVHELQCSYPLIRYLAETRQGVSYARDSGWRECKGAYVAYIDDDTTASPEWCEMILDAFTTVDPPPVAVGGNIVPRLDRVPPWWFSPLLELRSWGDKAGFLTSPTAHYGFSGANMAFTRQVLSDNDGFNHDYGMSGDRVWLGEEPELFMRIHRTQPYFWFDPEIEVTHYVPDSQLRLRGRLYRAFQSGRARKQLDGTTFRLSMLATETGGAFHLFRAKMQEKPSSIMYAFVSVLERIADRFGYFLGGSR
jgi:glycosyltransferase involved in cell wall biosynthesis